MRSIAFIPARGGSKSIPYKNIKLFCGKPLIFWSLSALQDANSIDDIFVATDDSIIEGIVSGFGLSKVKIFRRAKENAQDHSSTESVMLEFIEQSNFSLDDVFVLVQVTMPLLRETDIENGLKQFVKTSSDSLLSCARIKMFFWDETGVPVNYDYNKRPRRQEFKGSLMENGSFYINTVGNILKFRNRLCGKISVYEMPAYTSIDIDEEDDWIVGEKLMHKNILSRKGLSKIRAFFTDVDGTLTDSGMYYGETGDELKKFNTRDGKAFELLRNDGILTGIITTENTKIVSRRAEKLKVDFLFQGVTDKLTKIKEFCQKQGLSMDEIAYAGDDLNDIELLSGVGIAACPSDAILQVKLVPGIIILVGKGGEGAIREFVDQYLRK